MDDNILTKEKPLFVKDGIFDEETKNLKLDFKMEHEFNCPLCWELIQAFSKSKKILK